MTAVNSPEQGEDSLQREQDERGGEDSGEGEALDPSGHEQGAPLGAGDRSGRGQGQQRPIEACLGEVWVRKAEKDGRVTMALFVAAAVRAA